jgi:type 1 glutamine amidotransferase
MMPVAWIKTYTGESGTTERVFMTTMGHANDFKNEGFRRMVVNACYWATGLERKIPAKSNVDFVRPYDPNPIGLKKQKTGLKPSDLK